MKWTQRILLNIITIVAFLVVVLPATAQESTDYPEYWKEDWNWEPTARRGPNEGEGPYGRLIIWGATVIDGTGSPPYGPVNIVIKGNKIVDILTADLSERPENADRVIDARNMYVTPGFIDMHDVAGSSKKFSYQASYPYKLLLAHGITTVRSHYRRLKYMLKQQELSAKNKIIAPRIYICAQPFSGKEWEDRDIDTPREAREWVHYVNRLGIGCIGEVGNHPLPIMAAVLSTADSLGLTTMADIGVGAASYMNARRAVKLGLDELEHYYGLFESLLKEHTVPVKPVDYNNGNEYERFSQVGQLWDQIYSPGSEEWKQLINFFLKNNLILTPTLSIYSATRNPMAARNADWYDKYVLPSLLKFLQPNPESHGSFFTQWTSADEAAWQKFYNRWMRFVDDYNDAGGRILTGADTGFIYMIPGFGYIKELKMLQEAGLTPLEILRSATLYGAKTLFQTNKTNGKPVKFGVVRDGKLADLLVFTRNPLKDFNMLFGTGALRLNKKTGETYHIRALKYTIKDGIVYSTSKLLKDVRQMVNRAEQRTGVEVDNSPEGLVKLAAPIVTQ